jgi:hypothetical protein
MTTEIVRADGAMDLIVWVIVAIFWLIAQSATKKRKGGLPRPPSLPSAPPPGPRRIETDLKELFEALSGQKMDDMAQPQEPLPPIPYRETVQRSEPKAPRQRRAAKTLARAEPPPMIVAEVEAPATHVPEVHETVRHPGTYLRMAAPKTPSLTRMPRLPRVMMGENIRYGKMSASTARLFRTRKGITQAMIARVALGPPKGFG